MIQGTLYITNAVTLADGGTKYLIAHDSEGKEISVFLSQHFLEGNFNSSSIPGRLHFNEKPIAVRSEEEAIIIRALKESIIKKGSSEISFRSASEKIKESSDLHTANTLGPGCGTAYLMTFIIEFIESGEYEEIALKFSTNDR